MSLLREYIRQLLKEGAAGFVHDLASSEGEDFSGGDIDKQRGREIKQAFAKHADHQWLATLDTVHWVEDPNQLSYLVDKGRDELSTTIALPGDPLRSMEAEPYGLWVKGRITLASDTADDIYSGFYHDYGAPKEGTEAEVTHRDKSSGRNKRPTTSKTYKKYADLDPRSIPYVLDKTTWNPQSSGSTNEALVDNWKPVGIVVAERDVEDAILTVAKKMSSENASTPPKDKVAVEAILGLDPVYQISYFVVGAIKKIVDAALALGIPIFNAERTVLWRPE